MMNESHDDPLDALLNDLYSPPTDERLAATWSRIEPSLTRRSRMIIALDRTRELGMRMRPMLAAAAVLVLLAMAGLVSQGGSPRNLFLPQSKPPSELLGQVMINTSFESAEDYQPDEEPSNADGWALGISGEASSRGTSLVDGPSIGTARSERKPAAETASEAAPVPGGTASIRNDVEELRRKVAEVESAEHAPNSGRGVESLTSMKQKGAIRIGGQAEVGSAWFQSDEKKDGGVAPASGTSAWDSPLAPPSPAPESIENANRESEKQIRDLRQAGQYFLNRGDVAKAAVMAEEILRRDPANTDALALQRQAKTEQTKQPTPDREHDAAVNWALDVTQAAILPSKELIYPENWEEIKERVRRQRENGSASEEHQRVIVDTAETPTGKLTLGAGSTPAGETFVGEIQVSERNLAAGEWPEQLCNLQEDKPTNLRPFTRQPGETPLPAAADHRPQKIIKTAELSLEVDDFRAASAAVDAAVTKWGGFYADSRVTQHDNGTSSAVIVIRVPQQNFETLFAELKPVGRIRAENAKGEDVTSHYFDTQARIRNAEHMEQRLLAILAEKRTKDKMSEVLEVEREISRVREEIEKLQGQIRSLDDRIALGTIRLQIAEPERIVPAAEISVEVENATEASDSLDPVLAEVAATVKNRQALQAQDANGGRVTLELKVPMPRFGDLLALLEQRGRVINRNVRGYQPAQIARDAGAANVLASVRLTLQERETQLPGGSAQLEVTTLASATQSLAQALTLTKGTQISHQARQTGGLATATYVVRVPRGQFAQFVQMLGGIGRVTSRQIQGADVLDVPAQQVDVPCELSLQFTERSTPAPSASAVVSTAEMIQATAAVAALLNAVDGVVASHSEQQQPDGPAVASYTLQARRARFRDLVNGLSTIGRIEHQQAQGIDLESVHGAAADELCSLSLTLQERRAPVPGAVFEIVVEDAAKAATALTRLRDAHKGETLGSTTEQSGDATVRQDWRLQVPVAEFEALLARVPELGRVRSRRINDIGSAADQAPDPSAMARVAVTLLQTRPLTPSQEDTTGSLQSAIRSGWTLLYQSFALVLFGAIVVTPWALVVGGMVWLWRRYRRAG